MKMKKGKIEKEVKLLAKQKKFEQIYYEYGPKYFRKYVSRKYKKNDIRKLRQEGKYLDIYTKYGETYDKVYDKICIEDMENELGRETTLPERVFNKNFLIRKKYLLKRGLRILATSLLIGRLGTSAAQIIKEPENAKECLEEINECGKEINENEESSLTLLLRFARLIDCGISINAEVYAKEISEYEREVKEYAKEFDKESQSDMKIVMTMMNDMHERIKGYGQPKIDALGYWGMDVMDENGIGVCRHMAANLANELNVVNPEYNARIIRLYMINSDLDWNNIEKNIIDGDTRTNVNGNVQKVYENEQLQKVIISEEDSTIIYDENGKILEKIIEKDNKKEDIEYDEYGSIDRKIIKETDGDNEIKTIYDKDGNILDIWKTIKETDGDNEIEKKFHNGTLDTTTCKNKSCYISTSFYNDSEKISWQRVANKEEDIQTYYRANGQIRYRTIVKDGYKTTVYYNKQGQENERTKEETEATNIFLKLQEETFEEINRQNKEEIWGNHNIVAMDSTEDNITLLIDPTNLSLGIYKDGKIQMFNERQADKAIYDRKIIGEICDRGTEKIIQYPLDYIKSFKEPDLSMEELEEKYGVEAQNRMLEEIEREENKEKEQNKFKEELKIDTGITYNYDTNVVTIDNSKRQENDEKEH